MKFLRGGSWSVMVSIQPSKSVVQVSGKATRSSFHSEDVSTGVATAEPTSSSLDWITSNCLPCASLHQLHASAGLPPSLSPFPLSWHPSLKFSPLPLLSFSFPSTLSPILSPFPGFSSSLSPSFRLSLYVCGCVRATARMQVCVCVCGGGVYVCASICVSV